MSNQQIPNLPAAITLSGTEQLEAVQAGTSVKVSAAQIATYVIAVIPTPVREPFASKTANYMITSTDGTILCLANSFTVTLPTAENLTGQRFTVKNGNTLASGNTITMATTSAQTIDGSAPGSLTPLVTQTFQSDGANWWIL